MNEKNTKVFKTNLSEPITEKIKSETEKISKTIKPIPPLAAELNKATPTPEKVTPIITNKGKGIFAKYDNLNQWQKITVLAIVGTLVLSIVSYGVYFYLFNQPVSPAKIVNLSLKYIDPQNTENNQKKLNPYTPTLGDPSIPRSEVSPLNGKLFTKDEMDKLKQNRPVAVMINNHVAARPQSGLSSADIVYEAMAEGGISRYMGVFWSNTPAKVGPIRSAREYYLEWLSEFDALYIHDGCASSSDPRTNACGNISTFKIKDISTRGAWRVNDGIRYAPHNEYSSTDNAIEYAKTRDWDGFPSSIQALSFKKDASTNERGDKTDVKIKLRKDLNNGGIYDSQWIYDKASNLYQHKIGGQADYDNEGKVPVQAKVVIVQEVKMQDAYDGHSRVIITTTGTGKAIILQDGKITNGTWKKASRTDRTKYYDSKGTEIIFNRGLLWITMLPKDQGSFDIISQ